MQALFVVLGYLMGSLPTAYLAGRWLGGIDIRTVDNQIAGASNVFRHVGRGAGIAVAVIDISKGALAVVVADQAGAAPMVVALTGLAAIAGHSWPVWTGFRGGLGAASAVGVCLALLPRPLLIVAPVALIVLVVLRQPSPAAGTALGGGAVVGVFTGADPWRIGAVVVIALVVLFRALTWEAPDQKAVDA